MWSWSSPTRPCAPIARKTIERKSGARGLRSVMENLLMPVMYAVPSDPTIVRVTIDQDTVEGGEAPHGIRRSPQAV